MSEIPIPPAVASPPSSRTRRKSIARKHVHKPKPKFITLDLDAPAQAFLKVEANASLSKTLLGDDVSEDNFPARMAALIKKKRQALAE
nr:hypothetical protein [Tanacetum cinerariifolium]